MGVIKLCDLECLPLVRVDSPLRDILNIRIFIYNILIILILIFEQYNMQNHSSILHN